MSKWVLRGSFALPLIFILSLVSPRSVYALDFPSACTNQTGTVYEVGDGQPYTSIGAVPFDVLQPGDLVRIHYRAAAYHEKIAISTSGTENAPICLVGVPGPGGELPVIDGQNATTSANMVYDYDGMQERALLIVMGQEWGEQPAYIHIEGLHFKNAYEDYTFTTADGEVRNYTSNAAAVMIQRGAFITLTGLTISDSGNGFFTASSGDPEQHVHDVTLQYSYIYGNGTDSDQHHNIYTESDGMVIQFNHFGPLRSISGGNNIKDRSAGTIIRYNWIETGAHLIDLVEAEGGYPLLSQSPNYDRAWVYGNIMVSPVGNGTGRNMIHFGGDLGGEEEGSSSVCGFGAGEDPTECYRKGPLYFYNNTVITYSEQAGDGSYCCQKTYFRLQTDEQLVEAFNNIFHVILVDETTWVSYMNRRGRAHFRVNLVNSGGGHMEEFYNQEGPNSEVTGLENLIMLDEGESTGFVNVETGDYHLLPDSPAVNHGETITGPDLLPVLWEYWVHQESIARIDDGAIDLGAYEQGDNPPQATNTPNATSTPDVPTATPTLEPGVTELIQDGSFENQAAALWTVKNASGDKPKCNKDKDGDGIPDKIVAHTGNCAFQFKNVVGEAGKIQQVISLSAIIPAIGDVLDLSFYASGKSGATVKAKVVFKYDDDTKTKISLESSGVDVYTEFTASETMTNAAVVKSKIGFKSVQTSGKVYLDAVSLLHISSSTGLIGVPQLHNRTQ